MHQLARSKRQAVHKATLSVGHADLTAAATSQSIDFAGALPAGAIVLGVGIEVTEAFDDGGAGVFTADFGISGGDADAFLDGVDLETEAAHAAPQGAQPTGLVGAVTPALLVDAGGVNVNTATAGAAVVTILWAVGG